MQGDSMPVRSAICKFVLTLLCAGVVSAWGQSLAISAPGLSPASATTAAAQKSGDSGDESGPGLPAPSCSAVSDRAAAVDLKVALAHTQRLPLEEQGRLLDSSVAMWSQAVRVCDGRAKERAVRNLADSQKVLLTVVEQRGSGPRCEAAQRDANDLQDLANQAFADRRWAQASVMYRKTENLWEVAAERCTGSQQVLADTRRAQAEVDAHNAELCAPTFDSAREQSQKLKLSGGSMTAPEKLEQSMVAETLWRDALTRCKGAALETARNYAQLIARERGTPWVRKELPRAMAPTSSSTPNIAKPASAAPVQGAATAVAFAGGQVPNTISPNILSTPHPTLTVSSSGRSTLLDGAGPVSPAPPPALVFVPPSGVLPKPQLDTQSAQSANEIVVGDSRLIGKFSGDTGGKSYSGTGKVVWANGDIFEGTLSKGQPEGQGVFKWASGQRYEGGWMGGQSHGHGSMAYANGNQYTGEWIASKEQGQGRLVFPSGDVYVGAFEAGVFAGQGIYTWKNGQRYEGAWLRDQPNGTGTLKFSTGNFYEGTVVDGVPSGLGKMTYASGDVYEGQFEKGLAEGSGSYHWVTGTKFVGQWKNGLKEGRGQLTWPDGRLWRGMFQGDQQVNP